MPPDSIKVIMDSERNRNIVYVGDAESTELTNLSLPAWVSREEIYVGCLSIRIIIGSKCSTLGLMVNVTEPHSMSHQQGKR
jgi:hypothetical protein